MKQYDGQMSLFSEPKVRAEDVHFPKDYVCEGQMSIKRSCRVPRP